MMDLVSKSNLIAILKSFCFLTLFYFVISYDSLLTIEFYTAYFLKGKFLFVLFAASIDVVLRQRKKACPPVKE